MLLRMIALAAFAGAAEASGSCPFHLGGAHNRPNDPNALFQWLGQWHIMWQANGGWAHAVSSDLAHWTSLSVKTSLAVAGPNAWDGSLTILDGKPVALFDCTDPARDRVGHPRSCSGLNVTAAEASMDMARVGSGSGSGIGDPSFIGIARPVDLADPNLTATWKKDPTAPITFTNESGQPAAGYSGPSPMWTTADGVRNLVMTYGSGHTGLFVCSDPLLRNWTVGNHMFYPDRDAGGAMFLPLPGPPSGGARGASGGGIPYTHFLLGVTPGLGRGVAALGIYNASARTFSNTTGPPPMDSLQRVGTHPARGALQAGGCLPCGETAAGKEVCCSDLAAGYRKETYDAGDVKFGEVWVDPKTKRMLWFAWAGVAKLSVVREITYDPAAQALLMYPVKELEVLRDTANLLGTLASASVPAAGSLPLFSSRDNVTSFDVEAAIALPASGAAVAFGVAIMVNASGDASAVLTVNVSAAATDKTRLVCMAVRGRTPKGTSLKKPYVPASYNFTLGGGESALGLRILADTELVEVFVADGRGAITSATEAPDGGGSGVHFFNGVQGATLVQSATAWPMCA